MQADPINETLYQLGLGQSLVQALATGESWLADKNKLQRLSQITKVRRVQQLLDSYLKSWDSETIRIFIDNSKSSPNRFYARVAQYEFHSMSALKEKINQFPSGTKFFLILPSPEFPPNDQSLIELRAFLTEHGMSLAEQKNTP